MALVVIDGNQVVNRSFGDTKPGNNLRPRPDSLIRIASITKLMTSEVMVKMAAAGQVKLTDPLRKYAPKGAYVPAYNAGQPITLLNLATHTSALPREQPGKKPPKTPVFTWPTKAQRWQWLAHANVTVPPGVRAAYSNLAYDLLADALSRAAGKPHNALLKENHRAARHGRHHADAEPRAVLAPDGGGGRPERLPRHHRRGRQRRRLPTPRDMQRWMQQFLSSSASGPRKATAASEQTMYFQRHDLVSLKGMDVPASGCAGVGLGVYGAEGRAAGHHSEDRRRRRVHYLHGDDPGENVGCSWW